MAIQPSRHEASHQHWRRPRPALSSRASAQPKKKARDGARFQNAMLLSAERADNSRPNNVLTRLSEPARKAVLAIGRRQDLMAGDLLFRQGDDHAGVFLIEEGLVRSFYVSEDGRELTLGFWTAGHYVGAPQMFGGRPTRMVLGGRETHTLPIAARSATALVGATVAGTCAGAHRRAGAEIAVLLRIAATLATRSMRVRLARLLAMLAARDARSSIAFSHGEMASMIGSTRQCVSQTLARFVDEGLIEKTSAGAVCVVQPQLLSQLC